jgi:hypothetical protein
MERRNMRSWDELSMAERADVMKLAVEGGVYDLGSIREGYNEYASGGKIHIDQSKKGTFTAAASKHGMGVQQFASKVLAHPENYSPAMRKKANFARNAAKWKHKEGGIIKADEGTKFLSKQWFKNAGNDISSFLSSDTGKGLLDLGKSAFSGYTDYKNASNLLDS